MYKKNKGITLIVLVITIIILLILAGVTIAELTGNGLFEKTLQSVEKHNYANAEEKVQLAVMASYDNTGELNDKLLKDNLNSIDGIDPKVENVEYDLKVYVDGYEFLISKEGKVTGLEESKNNESIQEGEKYTFEYTGDYQEFNVQKTGYYRIELLGADGGSARTNGSLSGKGRYRRLYIRSNLFTKR